MGGAGCAWLLRPWPPQRAAQGATGRAGVAPGNTPRAHKGCTQCLSPRGPAGQLSQANPGSSLQAGGSWGKGGLRTTEDEAVSGFPPWVLHCEHWLHTPFPRPHPGHLKQKEKAYMGGRKRTFPTPAGSTGLTPEHPVRALHTGALTGPSPRPLALG